MSNKLLDFVEVQSILDNLSFTLSRLYHGDEIFATEEGLQLLTEKTYEVMEYMRSVHEELTTDPGVLQTAERLKLTAREVAGDVADIMILSTVAKQSILIERMYNQLKE